MTKIHLSFLRMDGYASSVHIERMPDLSGIVLSNLVRLAGTADGDYSLSLKVSRRIYIYR